MTNGKITPDDKRLISEAVKCSFRAVSYIVDGGRGKRKTKLQETIKKAIEFRAKQNADLAKKCNQLIFDKVSPK